MPQYGDRRTAQMKRRRHTPEQVICKLAEGEKLLAEGKNIEEVTRPPRDHRVDLAPLEKPIRRHEGQRRQVAERARTREHEAQADRGRPGPRHRDAEGVEPKKMVT